MNKIKITPEKVSKLKSNEIFVFGSNLAGLHGAGAALLAEKAFKAAPGIGEGLTGQCYALPTKDKDIQTLPIIEIYKSVEVLLEVVKNNTSKFFIITAVGCGLAGYTPEDIAPMFEPFVHLENCSLPQSFVDVIFPKVIKGYKVTDSNMRCKDFQFLMNKTFIHKGDVKICEQGFHFCKELKDCFNYYSFDSSNKVFEVEGTGKYDFNNDKVCVEKLKFIKELNWFDVLTLVNTGKGNSGLSNSGDYNSGDYNSGDCNSGNYNSGDCNLGECNSGDCNSGDYNSGDCNSGDCNSGDCNSGNRNSGYYNSGDYNSGYYNSGYYNSGDYNSGYYNSGYYNSGYYNSGDYNSGYFNTDTPLVRLFNIQSDIDFNSISFPYIELLINRWVSESEMTDTEKKDNPKFFVCEGYLKRQSYKEAWAEAWPKLTKKEQQQFLNLPHFNKDIFKEITGIAL
jgi:hypothetical protein